MKNKIVKKVLIYRLASLGDTIVALPCFHLIAKAWPDAERLVLTNFISNSKASHTSIIIENAGLVHGYLSYPVGLRNPLELVSLRNKIAKLKVDVLVYLAAPRGRLKAYRDAMFFRTCGIKEIIGVPYSTDLQNNRWLSEKECFEYEAKRLARCISKLGDARLDDPASWDLKITREETTKPVTFLQEINKNREFLCCAPGAKVSAKHWGKDNWQKLLGRLHKKYPDYALVFVGAENEFDECERAGLHWQGKKINLCGRLTPRESAVVLKHAELFIGHDSGPMHLSASVQTPCVAIFSARNKPEVWFPYGAQHKVIYHKTGCYGCGLEVCEKQGKKCIKTISVDEVIRAVDNILTI